MTTEQEKAYIKWFSDPAVSPAVCYRDIFRAGWEAAVNTAMPMPAHEIIHIARQNERDATEKKLLAMAGAAFIAGRDDHAHWFRSLVTVLFKNPGETSA